MWHIDFQIVSKIEKDFELLEIVSSTCFHKFCRLEIDYVLYHIEKIASHRHVVWKMHRFEIPMNVLNKNHLKI